MRSPSGFIAISEKKTRNINISGAISAASGAERFEEYESTPQVQEFESADLFPQDMLNEYKVEEVLLYGMIWLIDMSLSAVPADAETKLFGVNLSTWISRQPMTSWNPEDSINLGFRTFCLTATDAMGDSGSSPGITTDTVKKKRQPAFSPIKNYVPVRKTHDKIYVYSDATVVGYHEPSTAGGTVTGTANVECRLVEGLGYLPEEVEELLSPTQ
ncbi:hypothetical protein GF369_02220 [Candidatus Peregrinibacteria bacterium]|nr:hypothetical protein [Candidatus Peregrinibacteria bacterium]